MKNIILFFCLILTLTSNPTPVFAVHSNEIEKEKEKVETVQKIRPFAFIKDLLKKDKKVKTEKRYGRTDGFAIASFVCGILIIFLGLTAPLAITFGIIALRRIDREDGERKGKGLAIAGIVLGAIPVVIVLGFLMNNLIQDFF